MSVKLRGHHLLCLLGFRGMGYSPAFAANMADVYERLRREPRTEIEIVQGPDDLCACYPEDKPYHCDAASVRERDDDVLRRLGYKRGDKAEWRDILASVKLHMQEEDIPRMCATCRWLPYGVCQEGVARIAAGEGLPPLPEKR
ncbi:DUF1284 domain-containing protein [Paenibacillus antri]|nr:DUF1284 domain-containing protein [Paenibacillus antri]